MIRYVVFVQAADETSRVERIIGPFTTYRRAADYVKYMNTNCNLDGSLQYGVRELEKAIIQKM